MPPQSPEMSNLDRRTFGGVNPSSPSLSYRGSPQMQRLRDSPLMTGGGSPQSSVGGTSMTTTSPLVARHQQAIHSSPGPHQQAFHSSPVPQQSFHSSPGPHHQAFHASPGPHYHQSFHSSGPHHQAFAASSSSPGPNHSFPSSPLTRNSPVPQTLALTSAHTSPQVNLRRQPESPAVYRENGATVPDSPHLKNGGGSAQSSPSLKSSQGQKPPAAAAAASNGNKIKCVFIGDGAVGKTSLIISYTTNGYPNEYVPTAIDTYNAVVHVDGQPLTLELCDTPGQDDFDTLRPLVYPNTDVFLLCFSVALPSSFHNVREKWIPELRAHCGKVPVVLVGTQSDLREDAKTLVQLRHTKEQPVQEHEARKLAQSLGCEMYVECSSLTQRNLKDVFDSAIVAGISSRNTRERKKNKKKKKICTIL